MLNCCPAGGELLELLELLELRVPLHVSDTCQTAICEPACAFQLLSNLDIGIYDTWKFGKRMVSGTELQITSQRLLDKWI